MNAVIYFAKTVFNRSSLSSSSTIHSIIFHCAAKNNWSHDMTAFCFFSKGSSLIDIKRIMAFLVIIVICNICTSTIRTSLIFVQIRTSEDKGNIESKETKGGGSFTKSFRGSTVYNDIPKHINNNQISSLDMKSTRFINWKYKGISNPNISEQIFILGRDHITYYKPLCIDVEGGKIIPIHGDVSCASLRMKERHLKRLCPAKRRSAQKEHHFSMAEENKTTSWLTNRSSDIYWVKDLSIFQFLDQSCGNIAHFTGRVLFIHHILSNILIYSSSTSIKPPNILIFPFRSVLRFFKYPHLHKHYHDNFFKLLISPQNYSIGSLADFILRQKASNTSIVQVVDSYSVKNTDLERKKYVCFQNAIIPGFLKGRFFVSDEDFPIKLTEKKNHVVSNRSIPIPIPKDSLEFRVKASKFFGTKIQHRRKKIAWIDRVGSNRRILTNESKHQLITVLSKAAHEWGYEMRIFEFSQMQFHEQYSSMTDVALTIGVHGANLVNTIFMPPQSVLIEIFPYRFNHGMYRNGGNSGLKYFNYTIKSGLDYPRLLNFSSFRECVHYDTRCKVFYRDRILELTEEDLNEIRKLLNCSFNWLLST